MNGHTSPPYIFLCFQMWFSQWVSSTGYFAVWNIIHHVHGIPQHTCITTWICYWFLLIHLLVGFLGPLKSKNTVSVARFLKELSIPEVSPSATAASLNDRNKYSVHRTAAKAPLKTFVSNNGHIYKMYSRIIITNQTAWCTRSSCILRRLLLLLLQNFTLHQWDKCRAYLSHSVSHEY